MARHKWRLINSLEDDELWALLAFAIEPSELKELQRLYPPFFNEGRIDEGPWKIPISQLMRGSDPWMKRPLLDKNQQRTISLLPKLDIHHPTSEIIDQFLGQRAGLPLDVTVDGIQYSVIFVQWATEGESPPVFEEISTPLNKPLRVVLVRKEYIDFYR